MVEILFTPTFDEVAHGLKPRVYVRPYDRFRYLKWELVRAHFRTLARINK